MLEEKLKGLWPQTKHYEWEEDGKKYSSWAVHVPGDEDNRGITLNTNDAGMKMLQDAMEKEFKKYLEIPE